MEIRSKKELYEILKYEKPLYIRMGFTESYVRKYREHEYLIWKYVQYLRITAYYRYQKSHTRKFVNRYNKFMYEVYLHKKNKLGVLLGIEIQDASCDKGLVIWHAGSIVINSNVRMGTDCIIHGAVCIGNNGTTQDVPTIGNNVDIGYGACIIGGVTIADNVKIGAGAIVVKDVLEPGCTVVSGAAEVRRIVKHD